MPIKTMLVPIDGTEAGERCLEVAYTIAVKQAAHLEVFHVRADPKDAVPLLGEGMSGAMIEEMIELAEKEAHDRSSRARKFYDDFCARYDIPQIDTPRKLDAAAATWVEVTGREDEAVAVRGRLADVTVLARPTPDQDMPASMTLNAALFETGRAVLVVPPQSPAVFGRKMAVSWNGSAESSRAVAAGLPFLREAESVRVLSVHSARTPTRVARELSEFLAWHGVHSVTEPIEPDGRAVGEAVLRACTDDGVDMLVMGAYTHSRLRQLILGGVTRHVLDNSTIPVVMAR